MSRMGQARYFAPLAHLRAPFGSDRFGRFAERFARAFGAPVFLIAQTAVVVIWLVWNGATEGAIDPFPFILLNLAFSTQAAYAAPLILLAQTRQAERDHEWSNAEATHQEEMADRTLALLDRNTVLTQQVHELLEVNTRLTQQVSELAGRIEVLTSEIHAVVTIRP